MNRSQLLMLPLAVLIAASACAQVSPTTAETTPVPQKKTEKPTAEKQDKSAINKWFGSDTAGSNAPTTTEIYADEAFFDSTKSMGIFGGHVKVTDPRFNIQADKLTVHIGKGENQGLEKAVAEGNVAVVRDRADPNGGAPTRTVGRSDTATYTSANGNVELKGTPRVQQGLNTHIGTSEDTVMIINQNGQLTTHGPSRTDIRQQLKEETKAEAKPKASPKS